MTDDLKKSYQAIEAPPHLLTRIRAEARAGSRQRPLRWLPAGATLVAVFAILFALPEGEESSPQSELPKQPSLSALSSLRPARPASSPSLSQVRSVQVPTLPKKPKLTTAPETNTSSSPLPIEEKDHAHS